MNQIFLKNYKKSIEIGAFQEERQVKQDVAFHITVSLPDEMDVDDQMVDDILSYDVLIDAVEHNLAARRYELLEALAEDIAQEVLAHKMALSVEIEIEKLGRIEGALGVRIKRSGAGKMAIGAPKAAQLFVIYNLEKCPKISDDAPVVYLPLAHFSPIREPASQHIQTLELDRRAWELSQVLDLPVSDTITETQSLLERRHSFIMGYGKAVFAAQPPLEILSEDALIDWAEALLQSQKTTIIS